MKKAIIFLSTLVLFASLTYQASHAIDDSIKAQLEKEHPGVIYKEIALSNDRTVLFPDQGNGKSGLVGFVQALGTMNDNLNEAALYLDAAHNDYQGAIPGRYVIKDGKIESETFQFTAVDLTYFFMAAFSSCERYYNEYCIEFAKKCDHFSREPVSFADMMTLLEKKREELERLAVKSYWSLDDMQKILDAFDMKEAVKICMCM